MTKIKGKKYLMCLDEIRKLKEMIESMGELLESAQPASIDSKHSLILKTEGEEEEPAVIISAVQHGFLLEDYRMWKENEEKEIFNKNKKSKKDIVMFLLITTIISYLFASHYGDETYYPKRHGHTNIIARAKEVQNLWQEDPGGVTGLTLPQFRQ